MTSMTAEIEAGPGLGRGRRWALLMTGVATGLAAAMFVVGALVQQWVAGEHGQFHTLFAGVFLVPALVLATRRPHGGPIATPVIVGFTILAATQLIEGVGGFGYGPGNDGRVNALCPGP